MQITETLFVTSAQQWREWLVQHHTECKEIWLIYSKKSSDKTGISYEESVEEAWCFGWIDGATTTLPIFAWPVAELLHRLAGLLLTFQDA